MEQKPDRYLNADEYGVEVIEHARNLAGGYLEWKKTSPFTDTYKEEIRAEEISELGKEELQRILRAGKKTYAKIEQKVVRSAAEHVVIPLEYLFKIRRAGDFLRHCVCLSLASELDGDIGSIYADIPENHGKLYPTVELCECLYSVEKDRRLNCMRSLFEEKEAFRFFFGGELPLGIRTELRLEQRILQFFFSPESEPEALQSFTQLYYGSELTDKPLAGKVFKGNDNRKKDNLSVWKTGFGTPFPDPACMCQKPGVLSGGRCGKVKRSGCRQAS